MHRLSFLLSRLAYKLRDCGRPLVFLNWFPQAFFGNFVPGVHRLFRDSFSRACLKQQLHVNRVRSNSFLLLAGLRLLFFFPCFRLFKQESPSLAPFEAPGLPPCFFVPGLCIASITEGCRETRPEKRLPAAGLDPQTPRASSRYPWAGPKRPSSGEPFPQVLSTVLSSVFFSLSVLVDVVSCPQRFDRVPCLFRLRLRSIKTRRRRRKNALIGRAFRSPRATPARQAGRRGWDAWRVQSRQKKREGRRVDQRRRKRKKSCKGSLQARSCARIGARARAGCHRRRVSRKSGRRRARRRRK